MAAANAQVVDANIQLTPPTATNRVGSNHNLTCHVNVNDGTGVTNAPAGTVCAGSILSGPGAFVGPNQCTTVGTTGDCQLTITSATTGQTTIRASVSVVVGGVPLSRATGDTQPGDSPDAQKLWVNAAVVIAPNATNAVGQPHTFTATLLFDTGAGLQPAGTGQPLTVTLAPSNGAAPIPAGPFNLTTSASGQVNVTFTSPTAGQIAGNASSTVAVGGSAPFTLITDGVAPNSGAAVKTFVDANIQIAPDGQNPVGQPHVLTAHANVNAGTGAGFVSAPDGTLITLTIDSGPGSFSTPNPCTVAGGTGSCQVTLVSAVTGTTIVSAHTTVSVGGVALTRNTDGSGGNSGPATKVWVPAVTPPTISKSFSPSTIPAGSTSTLTFTIANPAANAVALTGVGVTDSLPPGISVASATASACGGTLTTTAPSTIALAGATVAANSVCQFSVTVLGQNSGSFDNVSGNVVFNGGTGGTAAATLIVLAPPPIPALGAGMLGLLALLLVAAAATVVGRRRQSVRARRLQ